MTLLGHWAGLPIFESHDLLVGPFEDWSDVRSPSRAERRRKRGFPQRIRFYFKPDPNVYRIGGNYVMHPATALELRRATLTPEAPYAPAA